MAALTRYEPIDDWLMDTLRDPARDPWRDMFRRLTRSHWPALRAPDDMRVDVTENDTAYTVRAEIPGAKKEDIAVKIEGNLVSIDAEIKEDKETKGDGERVLMREIYRGSMSRAFTLRHDVDDQQANAKFENGILTLTIPKRAGVKSTTLPIG
ncbi:Hsp20/alpha crystallin family protein [Sphaerotilus microaerophilus]|jgi:HSP20 family protein|uniref:Heat-shock protein Hsp20 n=1 Tax=Sphaerotilus microaerophilus TaxID=2914710 RepID=A0ABN6PLP7_9BURK|nr:Hsp20/alpha crystallin family protein [Sphaerotilus sp. FB-5]BDI05132.1 heat-shock protein Hsp20 [Sphaerotilus sp. FB-5]